MSKVYKWDEIVLGEEKLVKLKSSQIIKAHKDKEEQKKLRTQTHKGPEETIEDVQAQASAILEAARLESDEIIARTQREQQAIISEAYTESNIIFENARQKGYEEGLSEGQNEGLQTVDHLIKEAKQIKQDTLNEKKHVAKKLEKEIIQLVISSIKKVINYEIEKNHELLLNLVESGIEKCTYTDTLIIRVSTNNYDMVNSYKNKIYMMTEGIDNIEVKKDPALEDGSIIIETISGTVDASLQTQIAQIELMFHDILKGE